MNIEKLNSCFDGMSPTKEQKDKMLANVFMAKKQPVKVVKLHRYWSFAAAVVALGVFAAVYSGYNINEKTIEGTDIAVVDNTDKTKVDVVEKNVVAETDKPAITETENQVAKTETKPEFSELIKENYPEITDTKVAIKEEPKTENAVIETDKTGIVEETPEVASESYEVTYPAPEATVAGGGSTSGVYTGGSAGGSSGGGGGGGASVRSTQPKSISFDEIKSHSVYATLFPQQFADGFAFDSASEKDGWVFANFLSDDGRYMMISIAHANSEDFVQPYVVSAGNIKSMTMDGYVEFAVKCGDYYVMYCIETTDANSVYEMVTSSAFYE